VAGSSSSDPPRAPAFLLGVGLGGFVDGIALHQILQFHHMLTGTGDEPMTTLILGGLTLARSGARDLRRHGAA
jgi:uncharacterized membrane protein